MITSIILIVASGYVLFRKFKKKSNPKNEAHRKKERPDNQTKRMVLYFAQLLVMQRERPIWLRLELRCVFTFVFFRLKQKS